MGVTTLLGKNDVRDLTKKGGATTKRIPIDDGKKGRDPVTEVSGRN